MSGKSARRYRRLGTTDCDNSFIGGNDCAMTRGDVPITTNGIDVGKNGQSHLRAALFLHHFIFYDNESDVAFLRKYTI